MHRRALAGTLLAAVAVGSGIASIAALRDRDPQPAVRFWMRDDDPTRIFDRPDGRVLARVTFSPHVFGDESGAATFLERAAWFHDALERAGLAPRLAAPWSADFVETRREDDVTWHRFVRTSGLAGVVRPDAALAGSWRVEDPHRDGPWDMRLAATGDAERDVPVGADAAAGRGRWGACDGVIEIRWNRDAPQEPRSGPQRLGLDTLTGVVADDRATIRGIAGTRWTARRATAGAVPERPGR